MSFQTALSGLNAAQTNLSVTGNNIANASTNGFKRSRAEFADIYTSSFTSTSQVGSGVRVADIAQQFSQGNVEFTDNSLDLAISGEGFFMLQDQAGTPFYTRAGAYQLDREGFVVNSKGQYLTGFGYNALTDDATGEMGRIEISSDTSPANATTNTRLNMNVNADSVPTAYPAVAASYTTGTISDFDFVTTPTSFTVDGVAVNLVTDHTGATALADLQADIQAQLGAAYTVGTTAGGEITISATTPGATPEVDVAGVAGTDFEGVLTATASDASVAFDPADPNTYNFSTSTTVYDSLGGSHTQTLYFRATEVDNEWETHMAVDGTVVGQQDLEFGPDGSLVTTPATLVYGNYDPANGALLMANMEVDYTGTTQFAGDSVVNTIRQDGYTTGRISGIAIDSSGFVFARYTNGQSEVLGVVALARFENPNGLQPVGDTNWVATFESGAANPGVAGRGAFGQIQSGSLEASNVDLSTQLVNMIIAQRDFQANAKMISTADAMTQTIINIR